MNGSRALDPAALGVLACDLGARPLGAPGLARLAGGRSVRLGAPAACPARRSPNRRSLARLAGRGREERRPPGAGLSKRTCRPRGTFLSISPTRRLTRTKRSRA